MGWKEKAIEACLDEERQSESERAREKQKRRDWLVDKLAEWTGERLCIPTLPCEIDGVKFGVTGGDYAVVIYDNCLVCNEEVPSDHIYNLAELGKMIRRFRPAYRHDCTDTSASAAEKLIANLREILSETDIPSNNKTWLKKSKKLQ